MFISSISRPLCTTVPQPHTTPIPVTNESTTFGPWMLVHNSRRWRPVFSGNPRLRQAGTNTRAPNVQGCGRDSGVSQGNPKVGLGIRHLSNLVVTIMSRNHDQSMLETERSVGFRCGVLSSLDEDAQEDPSIETIRNRIVVFSDTTLGIPVQVTVKERG